MLRVIHSVHLHWELPWEFLPFLYSSFSFAQSLPISLSCSCITSVSLVTLWVTLFVTFFSLSCLSLSLFILTYSSCSAVVSPLRSCCSSILAILSLWLIRCYFSTLSLFSHSLPLSLVKSFSIFFPCYLVDVLLYLARAALFSLPSISPSRLHSHDAFFAFLFLFLFRVRCSFIFLFFHVFTTAVELISLLYLLLFLILISDSFLLRAPLDPRWAVFLFFFFLRSIIFFFRMDRRFIFSMQGRLKIS